MKKVLYYFAVAATCMLAACSQKEALVEKTPVTPVSYILAQGNENTKAGIDDNADFTWKAGDRIAVFADSEYKLSDALVGGESSSATFSFSGTEAFDDSHRANLALYPASLACDEFGDKLTGNVTATSLEISLPNEYNLSDVKDTKSPVFMVATNTSGASIAFKHLGALLRFKLVSVPKQTQYITFDFNGKRVCGPYTLSSVVPGTTAIVAEDTSADDDIITVYNDAVFTTFQTGLVVNIPVPTGSYTDVTITTWDGEPGNGGHKINALTTPINSTGNWTPGRADARKRLAHLPVFTLQGNWDGLNNGVKVVFAPGNLVATMETKPDHKTNLVGKVTLSSLHFAQHQYSTIGATAANLLNAVGDVDLFSWIGESATYNYEDNEKVGIIFPSYGSLSPKPSNWYEWLGNGAAETIKYDWGQFEISDGIGTYPAGTWRLPNIGKDNVKEWQRVLTARKNGTVTKEYCCAKATIKDGENTIAQGLLVFPDFYSSTGMPSFVKTDGAALASHYADNVITLAEWEKLEAVGCVFLPVTNARTKGSTVQMVNNADAAYWANFAPNTSSGSVMVVSDADVCTTSLDGANKTNINTNKSCPRQNGASVRLVRQVN